MLPPIDEVVLQSNPKFAALHSTLANNILNPSGSTKKQAGQKERDAVSEALRTTRLKAARTKLLIGALNTLDLNPEPLSNRPRSKSRPKSPSQHHLPPDLVDLILLLSARLSSHSPAHPILETTPQWASPPFSLPRISALLSARLHAQALALCRIQSPTTNPSFLHRSIPKLVSSTQETLDSHASMKLALAERRAAIVATATVLMDAYHLATVLVIQTLEAVCGGAVSRHAGSRADYWALRANEIGVDVQEKKGKAEEMIYTPAVRDALENYIEALRDGRERLKDRERGAERALWGYGVGRDDGGEKERVMKEIARVYGELGKEVEDVRKDVERLRGGGGKAGRRR